MRVSNKATDRVIRLNRHQAAVVSWALDALRSDMLEENPRNPIIGTYTRILNKLQPGGDRGVSKRSRLAVYAESTVSAVENRPENGVSK
jgi:hypothetical protein